MAEDPLDTSRIKKWQSIITLIIFVFTNVIVLFPFWIPIYVPKAIAHPVLDVLAARRVRSPRGESSKSKLVSSGGLGEKSNDAVEKGINPSWLRRTGDRFRTALRRCFGESGTWMRENCVRYRFHVDFVTAPLIADLLLLALGAIGREEVHDGTVGTNGISPIDIMVFFITLAYIAISLDASGLIRYLAFKVLQKGGKNGHWLFFYLYVFFFALTSFIGNDPIVLSGTAFLAYMTRVSSNIHNPRAWIFTQFTVANMGSAILVSSNPTNLVLVGAFEIKFLDYTANIIVPVVITAILMFPYLLWIIFPYEKLIPYSIDLHELPEDRRKGNKDPVNPNIPFTRSLDEDEDINSTENKLASLEEIMNPFLDKGGAWFGAVIMAVTLVTILALNAASEKIGHYPVFYITLPAALIMFCWDMWFGWSDRTNTRRRAREGRDKAARVKALKKIREEQSMPMVSADEKTAIVNSQGVSLTHSPTPEAEVPMRVGSESHVAENSAVVRLSMANDSPSPVASAASSPGDTVAEEEQKLNKLVEDYLWREANKPATLTSKARARFHWFQDTFPTVMAVLQHLPIKLIPFAFCMFVLVQALVTKGWVPVFAYGWDHWVQKTGTIGAIGGMGFLSVIMCNFAGTNIGTTILLCRVVQTWILIHERQNSPIVERTFWATVYSMALGVNYGAFSTAFSASLAGLLWRDILARKHILVKASDFARINLRIIAFAMAVGCVVLLGEVWIMRDTSPFHPSERLLQGLD